jgi:hypothetical protein
VRERTTLPFLGGGGGGGEKAGERITGTNSPMQEGRRNDDSQMNACRVSTVAMGTRLLSGYSSGSAFANLSASAFNKNSSLIKPRLYCHSQQKFEWQ